MMKPRSFSRNTQVLARETKHDKVNGSEISDLLPSDFSDVAQIWHTLIVVLQDSRGKFVYLREPNTHPTERKPRHTCGIDTGKKRNKSHAIPLG
jgi:hypothetical protein